MKEIKRISIDKNRGWRGLAEVRAFNELGGLEIKSIFSFSQPVWDDLMHGRIVLETLDTYVVLELATSEGLPIGHQRSVLLKSIVLPIEQMKIYNKSSWLSDVTDASDLGAIDRFTQNRNNHTRSAWNDVGIRVTPLI